jgi:3-hydroxyisobutyrate dehydrogenase-like beta-hydroxyacid dehydrogenase
MAGSAPVGIIGLGLMGSALSARLIDAGVPIVGFDIDPAKRLMLDMSGGEAAGSAADVMTHCQIIVVAVFDSQQIEMVLKDFPHDVSRAQPIMICTTTCAPKDITKLARRAGKIGLRFVEAPISGTSAEVRQGSALVLVAGEAEAIEAAAPILDILCPRRTRAGRIGDPARTKLAINLILQNNRAALAEGIAFAESMGLDAAAFLATARQSPARSAVMDSKGDKMVRRDFTPQSHISQTLKDAELILEEARQRKQHLPLTLTQTALLRAAIALSGPDADSSAIIGAIRPSSGASS